MIASGFSWFVTLPTKPLTAPFIDAFGKSAWEIMLRSTDLLYHTDGDFSTASDVAKRAHMEKGYQHVQADGGLSVFMRRLQEELERNGGADAWDITLVGHSMGTIVLNRLIHDFGTSPSGTMPFNRIVYMAAAASVKEYEDSVFPYLAKNPRAQFYHLTLHVRAEARDRWEPVRYVDLPPRGSCSYGSMSSWPIPRHRTTAPRGGSPISWSPSTIRQRSCAGAFISRSFMRARACEAPIPRSTANFRRRSPSGSRSAGSPRGPAHRLVWLDGNALGQRGSSDSAIRLDSFSRFP